MTLLTFAQLPLEEQEAAVVHEYRVLIELATDGFEFTPDIQAMIQKAGEECERLMTPWFFGQAVDEYAGDLLMPLARETAQQLLYVPQQTALSSYRPKC